MLLEPSFCFRGNVANVRVGSKPEVTALRRPCPLCPQQPTLRARPDMSVKGHQRTHALRQKAPCGITSSARAHHRVERTDRDARHEVRSMRSRATSSTKPPLGDKMRECGATLQRSERSWGTVTLPGITAAFVLRRVELRRRWNSLWCYLYAFCNCPPQRSN